VGPFAEQPPDPEGQDERQALARVTRTCPGTGERCPYSAKITRDLAPFCAKIRGHLRYYGVSFNHRALAMFITQATRIMYKWLHRRSQRRSFTWEKLPRFMEEHPLPRPVIYTSLFDH